VRITTDRDDASGIPRLVRLFWFKAIHVKTPSAQKTRSQKRLNLRSPLGLCGVAAAVADAMSNATGVRVRDYPNTLDKLLERTPEVR
jgi:CO/xanthine dehydrogenase Mo-binding subunit